MIGGRRCHAILNQMHRSLGSVLRRFFSGLEIQAREDDGGVFTADRSSARAVRNPRGAALLIALVCVTILMVVATEISYQTSVEYGISAQGVNNVKAYYAAKSGIELSLLRINLYQQVAANAGDKIPRKILDLIWQFPFQWPPVVPGKASAMAKSEINDAIKDSLMQAKYAITIFSEGGKIDVNDLASPSTFVSQSVRKQILQIFNSEMENNQSFNDRNRGVRFDELLNNMTDWIDSDMLSKNGGDETQYYARKGFKNMPPNQPFKSLEELHMIEGMTDEFYNLLAPRLTVYGIKGISVNQASKEVLMSLTPVITEEKAAQIITRRSDPDKGPFIDFKQFLEFLNSECGINGNPFADADQPSGEPGKPEAPFLVFDPEVNFRIRAIGSAGKVDRVIEATVFDLQSAKFRLSKFVKKEIEKDNPPPQVDPNKKPDPNKPEDQNAAKDAKNQDPPPPKPAPGRPNVVYWSEK